MGVLEKNTKVHSLHDKDHKSPTQTFFRIFSEVSQREMSSKRKRVVWHSFDRKIQTTRARTDYDYACLSMAVVGGHVSLVKSLLRDGRGDPAANNNEAIRAAAGEGHQKVVKLLLDTQNRGIEPAACATAK